MAETYEGLIVKFGADTTSFDTAITQVNRNLRSLQSMQSALNKALRFDSGNYDLLNKKLQNTKKQYDIVKQRIEENTKKIQELGDVTDNNVAKFDKLNNAIIRDTGELNALQKQMQAVNNQINALPYRSFEKLGQTLDSVGKKAEAIGQKLSVVSTAIGAGLGASIKQAIDFESAFAGVAKTVDATDAQLEQLRQGIIDLSTEIPASTDEISAVAESAGQLGIATDDILGFTETMLGLGTATNLTADDAATMIAQFANVTGMEGDYDKLGSALVALGNDGASTESQIMELAQRLSGAGATAGFSEQAILALGAAMANVGINAEAGGTSMSTFISKLESAVATGGEDLENFASVAGLSAQEFADQWETEPVKAIEAFLGGLAEIDKSGGSAIVTLEDLGLKETRMRDMLLRLSNAEGELSHALEVSNTGWEENVALQNEVDKRNETVASQLEMMKNRLVDIARIIGEQLTPFVSSLNGILSTLYDWFTGLSSQQQKMVAMLGAVATATSPAVLGFGKLSQAFGGWLQSASKAGDISPILKSINAIPDGFSKIFSSGFGLKGFADVGKNIVSAIGDGLKTATKPLQKAMTGVLDKVVMAVAPTIGGLEARFKGIFVSLGNAISPVANKISTVLGGAFSKLGGFMSPITNSIGTLVTGFGSLLPLAIAGLVASFAYLMATNEDFRNSVIEIAQGIWDALQPLFTWVKSFVQGTLIPLLKQLLPIFEQLWASIITVIQEVLLPILNQLVQFFVTYILPTLSQLFNMLMTYLVPAFQLVADVITWLIDNVIVPLWDWFANNILPIINKVAETVRDFLTPIIGGLSEILGEVVDWLSKAFGWLSDLWDKMLDSAPIQGIIGFFENLAEVLGRVWDWLDGIIGFFADIGGYISGKVGDFINWAGGLFSSGGLGARAELMASGGVGIRNLSVQTTINVNNQGEPIGSNTVAGWADMLVDEVSYKLARRLPSR